MISIEQVSASQCFSGQQLRFKHSSLVLNCEMYFSIFIPTNPEQRKLPVLYWLSGLTCSDENFVTKAGAQQYAERYKVIIVAPDTSPRGEGVADDEQSSYDFGLGAGFYLNATIEPFSKHYQMYDYIVEELPSIINQQFPVDTTKVGIFGHSMGGHGALTIGLKNPQQYRSISAFSPICSTINCPWGQKALTGYLGQDPGLWRQYDAVELLKELDTCQPILIEQGLDDDFLQEQLKPELLEDVAADKVLNVQINMHQGYDHSYFFIASFIEQQIKFHSDIFSTSS